MAIPTNPPKDARIRLSVTSSRMSRKRPAPSANRTAISRVRVRARLRRSPATLVQATSRTASPRITKITPNFQLAIVAVLEKILLAVGGKHPRHRQRHVEVGMPEDLHPREGFRCDANHGG